MQQGAVESLQSSRVVEDCLSLSLATFVLDRLLTRGSIYWKQMEPNLLTCCIVMYQWIWN